MSRANSIFSDIFLCLYREYAAPGELFSAILVRFDRVRDYKSVAHPTKMITQLRIIDVVTRWVSLYPGDFAGLITRSAKREEVKAGNEESEVESRKLEAFPQEGDSRFCWLRTGPLFALT